MSRTGIGINIRQGRPGTIGSSTQYTEIDTIPSAIVLSYLGKPILKVTLSRDTQKSPKIELLKGLVVGEVHEISED